MREAKSILSIVEVHYRLIEKYDTLKTFTRNREIKMAMRVCSNLVVIHPLP